MHKAKTTLSFQIQLSRLWETGCNIIYLIWWIMFPISVSNDNNAVCFLHNFSSSNSVIIISPENSKSLFMRHVMPCFAHNLIFLCMFHLCLQNQCWDALGQKLVKKRIWRLESRAVCDIHFLLLLFIILCISLNIYSSSQSEWSVASSPKPRWNQASSWFIQSLNSLSARFIPLYLASCSFFFLCKAWYRLWW